APHDAGAIMEVVGDRKVRAILLTHAHSDHVDAVFDLKERTGAPIHLHPDDRVLWDLVHEGRSWDEDLADGQRIEVGGTTLHVLHTPGHAPGACCFHAPELGVLFSGDTLFSGGPGATGRSHSSFGTIIDSITDKILTLPEDTVVHTGHGDSTSVGAEKPQRQEWIDRGH
ncbi:MAG: Zn-dependent hydrolase, partial [Acidobacteria bacterium]